MCISEVISDKIAFFSKNSYTFIKSSAPQQQLVDYLQKTMIFFKYFWGVNSFFNLIREKYALLSFSGSILTLLISLPIKFAYLLRMISGSVFIYSSVNTTKSAVYILTTSFMACYSHQQPLSASQLTIFQIFLRTIPQTVSGLINF